MPRNPDMPCAGCGKLIWRSRTSLPAGLATCHSCRRKARVVAIANRAAAPKAPPRRKPSSNRRGYGYQHQLLRKHLLATFVDGTPCARCGQPMFSTEPMDLDHSDDRSEYLGLSHSTCNRARKPVARTTFGTHDCPICGAPGVRWRQKTCSRACGVEWKRLAA